MHKVFVEQNNSDFEKNLFFEFFTIQNTQIDDSSRNIYGSRKKKNVLKSKTREAFFKIIFTDKLNPLELSLPGYKCFEANFQFINAEKGLLTLKDTSDYYQEQKFFLKIKVRATRLN